MRFDVFSSMLDEPSPSPPREAPTSAAAHGSAWEVPRDGKIGKYGEKRRKNHGKSMGKHDLNYQKYMKMFRSLGNISKYFWRIFQV